MRNYKTPLQKRHFEFIAATLAKLEPSMVPDFMFAEIVTAFRRELKATNPYFNGERFHDACWINREEK